MRLRPPPEGLVDLSVVPGVRCAIGYHRADNFTGAPLPGYGAEGAWLVREAAARLFEVTRGLRDHGLGLVVYDAYRPVRATRAMVTYCETRGRAELLQGYVGRRSRHNRGAAVDVGLYHLESGGVLPMGTAWDAFEVASGDGHALGAHRANRAELRAAMERHGFAPYAREWWHYELAITPAPPELDVPYGAEEPNSPPEPDSPRLGEIQ